MERIITAQNGASKQLSARHNFSRDSRIALTIGRKRDRQTDKISHAVYANLSLFTFKLLNIGNTCYLYTQRSQQQTAYSLLTSPVQFLDLMKKVKPKVIKAKKTFHHLDMKVKPEAKKLENPQGNFPQDKAKNDKSKKI